MQTYLYNHAYTHTYVYVHICIYLLFCLFIPLCINAAKVIFNAFIAFVVLQRAAELSAFSVYPVNISSICIFVYTYISGILNKFINAWLVCIASQLDY